MITQISTNDDAWHSSEQPPGLIEQHSGSFYRSCLGGLAGEESIDRAFRILSGIQQAVMITDRHGIIQFVNKEFSRLTGYAHQEVRGLSAGVLKSGEMTAEFFRDLWATLLDGREWHGEFHNRKKNGESYWEFSSIWPITSERGRIEHFLAIKTDITERKARAAEQRRTMIELQRALAAASSMNGFVCMCGGCNSIRDADQGWIRIDRYLSARFPVKIGHVICPSCKPDPFERIALCAMETAPVVQEDCPVGDSRIR